MVVLDSQEHFSAWHIFLIVCAIPTPLAVVGLMALPESPRILLQIGHESEALVIYQVGIPFFPPHLSFIYRPLEFYVSQWQEDTLFTLLLGR